MGGTFTRSLQYCTDVMFLCMTNVVLFNSLQFKINRFLKSSNYGKDKKNYQGKLHLRKRQPLWKQTRKRHRSPRSHSAGGRGTYYGKIKQKPQMKKTKTEKKESERNQMDGQSSRVLWKSVPLPICFLRPAHFLTQAGF